MEGGLCDSTSGAYAGKVVHCLRGTITLADKVANAEDSGAIAVVISNNAPDGFSDALGAYVSGIPAVSVSQEDGATLTGDAAQSATVVNMLDPNKTGYEPWDGDVDGHAACERRGGACLERVLGGERKRGAQHARQGGVDRGRDRHCRYAKSSFVYSSVKNFQWASNIWVSIRARLR